MLRIIVSIGGVEVNHFAVWHDKAGNAVAQPLAGVTDPETGTHFPDLNARDSELFQTNLIFPEPCDFLDKGLPACSVIRPSHDAELGRRGGGARAHRRQPVQGPDAGLLPDADAPGPGCGRRTPHARI